MGSGAAVGIGVVIGGRLSTGELGAGTGTGSGLGCALGIGSGGGNVTVIGTSVARVTGSGAGSVHFTASPLINATMAAPWMTATTLIVAARWFRPALCSMYDMALLSVAAA
jgi:hypothetical protein